MGLKAILKNKTTFNAILYTLAIFIVYRIGSHIITPGANIDNLLGAQGMTSSGATIFQLFGGGNISILSVFMLGVAPYVTASIIIQLLETDLVPSMGEWKHQGVDGERKRSEWTKRLALIMAFIQAFGIILIMNNVNETLSSAGKDILINNDLSSLLIMSFIVTAGVAIMMWLADRITEFGIGNGISVIIMVNIIAAIPSSIILVKDSFINGIALSDELSRVIQLVIVAIIQILVIIAVVYYNLAKRKVNINYVRSSKGKLNEQSYLPIKLNPAGVIPVIFVTPLMALPSFILRIHHYFYTDNVNPDGSQGWIENTINTLFNYNSSSNEYWYIALLIYIGLIIAFSVFYSYVQMNPQNMMESLEKQGAYVVGVRPGAETEKYFENVIYKTALIGGSFLALIAATPIIISHFINTGNLRLSLLGTGIIIIVSVLIQTFEGLQNKVETKTYRKLFGGEN